VPGGKHFAPYCLFEQPRQRQVAGAPEIGRHASPVKVHVDGERRRRRVVGKAALLANNIGERESHPPELRRHRQPQVTGLLELVEILGEEAALPVVFGRSRGKPRQHVVGEKGRPDA
jgi:hypothetical protein